MNNRYVLGFDTSNYKTSLAVIDDKGNIVADIRRLLKVKSGERGLRQSEALFQHIKVLPELMRELRACFDGDIDAVSASSRPRPVDGSYMPVFLAGESMAGSIAEALKIPFFTYSHQEGHIEAVKAFSPLKTRSEFMACHFSGGTCELVKCTKSGFEVIGGTRDISFGQVIDRGGVAMGYDFPAGEALDKIAAQSIHSTNLLTKIKVKDAYLNLSGIDTQIKNILGEKTEVISNEELRQNFIREIFEKLCDSMIAMIRQGTELRGISDVIITGGVSSSMFMKSKMREAFSSIDINPVFGDGDMAQDNAVGIALLGGNQLWG